MALESQRARFCSSSKLIFAAVWLAVFPCNSIGEDAPTTRASTTQESSVIDLPKLEGISIDGHISDWADRGYQVLVMHASPAHRLPAAELDGQLRLGWNDRGLLLLAEVTEPELHESDSDLELGLGASVEVIIDGHNNKEHFHLTIAPGVDAKHPVLRKSWYDDRSKKYRQVKLSADVAASRTAHGYVVEALFPWDLLAVDARIGSSIGVAVHVIHPVGQQTAQLAWSSKQVHLASAPSPAQAIAVDGGYERYRHVRISVASLAEAAGRTAVFKIGNAVLGQTTLQKDPSASANSPARLAVGDVQLPMPPIGKTYGTVRVLVDGAVIGSLTLPNAADARRAAAAGLDLVADPCVFTQSGFPIPDFYNPGGAENLLGNYTIHTTYYDADYNAVTSADRPGRYGAVVEVKPEFGKPFKRYLTLYHQTTDFSLRPLDLLATMRLPAKFGVDSTTVAEQTTAASDLMAAEVRNSRRRDNDLAIYLAGMNETPAGAANQPRRLGPDGRDTLWWYGLKKMTGNLVGYKYLVHLPRTVATTGPIAALATNQAKYPLILFLHGSGQRGTNLEVVKDNGPPKILKNEPGWVFKDQFIIVSPQCQVGTWNPLLLRDLLDEVMAQYPVDPDRVYLTGLSMGGFGTWDFAQWFPERFAAIVPICGGGDPTDVSRLKEMPTWIFHGGRDPTVRIENAYEMVQSLRDIHARVRFTIYAEYGHNSWEEAYDDPELYRWLLRQRRGRPDQPPATAAGTQPAEQ